jgi:hypothetical protein
MKYKKDTDFENVNNNNGFGNLIPITLNIDIDGKKFTDQFFWEKDEPYLSVEQYSKILIEENNLPKSFDAEIINQITKQINGYSDFFIGTNDEMIKIIKLDVRIDDRVLTDSFIWDINNPMNIPENFAVDYCRDLNLGSEFIVPISLSIREQLIEHGDWGLGIGDWGLGIGPNPQSPIPNPQSPIPILYCLFTFI